jgi:hypothetical protein
MARQPWLQRLFSRAGERGSSAAGDPQAKPPSIDDLKSDSSASEHLGAIDPEQFVDDDA